MNTSSDTDHVAFLREGREEVWKRNASRSEEALDEILVGAPVQVARCLRQAKKTGAWLMVQPLTLNGKELGVQE